MFLVKGINVVEEMIIKMLIICEKDILASKSSDEFMDYIKRELLTYCYQKLKDDYYHQ